MKSLCRIVALLGLVLGTLGPVATALAQSTTPPAGWPAALTWYSYTASAPQPMGSRQLQIHSIMNVDYVSFDSLPLQDAIVRVHGNGERKIAMFADPNCRHSQDLERIFNELPNVTIYTFVLPLLGQASNAMVDQIRCQPTNQSRAQAYDAWMLARVAPQVVAPCANTANAMMQALQGLQSSRGVSLSSTAPFEVYDNNILMTGTPTALQLSQIMQLKAL